MSVAFRRESDEEHLEPRFELPIPPGRNLVTPRGLQLIEARVEALETALRAADPNMAKPIARDLRYWRARLASAELTISGDGDAVAFGSRVHIRVDDRERALEIVGHDEADAATDRIGFTAPLAKALIGAMAGDLVDFGHREAAIEVLAVGTPAAQVQGPGATGP